MKNADEITGQELDESIRRGLQTIHKGHIPSQIPPNLSTAVRARLKQWEQTPRFKSQNVDLDASVKEALGQLLGSTTRDDKYDIGNRL